MAAHSIEFVNQLLDEIAESLPEEFFRHLNGGIVLLEEVKYHPAGKNRDLVILGEYHNSLIGNHIRIYHGSLTRVYGGFSQEKLKDKLRETLLHEFRHHFELMAGDHTLEKEDALKIEIYRSNQDNEKENRNGVE